MVWGATDQLVGGSGVARESNGTPACHNGSSPLTSNLRPAVVEPTHTALSPLPLAGMPSQCHVAESEGVAGGCCEKTGFFGVFPMFVPSLSW